MIFLGENSVNPMLGSKMVNRIYKGDALLYSRTLPPDIDDLGVWFDGDDRKTMFEVMNGVSAWQEKGPNQFVVFQENAAFRPSVGVNTINGRDVLTFNGSTNRFTSSLNFFSNFPDAANTVLVVARASLTTGSRYAYSILGGGGRRHQVGIETSGFNVGNWHVGGNAIISPDIPRDTQPHLMGMIFDGSQKVTSIYDNAEVVDETAGVPWNTGSFHIGAWNGSQNFWAGDIAEIITYSRALEPDELNALKKQYLSPKWGLAL